MRPARAPVRHGGIVLPVHARRSAPELPPLVLDVEPQTVADAWRACWDYGQSVADPDDAPACRRVAYSAWVAVKSHIPALAREELVARLLGESPVSAATGGVSPPTSD